MITFSCPECNKKLKVADNKAGAKVKCPACQAPIPVPLDFSDTPAEGAVEPKASNAVTAKEREPRPVVARVEAPASRAAQRKKGEDEEDFDDEEDEKPSRMGLWIGLGVGGAVLCAGIVAVIVMLTGDKDASTGARNANANSNPAPVEKRTVTPTRPAVVLPIKAAQGKEDDGLELLTAVKTKPEPSDIIPYVLKSTAWVIVGNADHPTSYGTGTLIDRRNRLVLTAYHVVANASKFVVIFPIYKNGKVVTNREEYLKDGTSKKEVAINGKLLAEEKRKDLALIQLDRLPRDVQALPFAAKSVSAGDTIHSLGNAGGSAGLWTYTPGQVRGVQSKFKFMTGGGPPVPGLPNLFFEVEADVVETNSATNPGDSGGPLVNDNGEFVGVTHGFSPMSRALSLFIDRTEAIGFVRATTKSKGMAWMQDGQPLRASAKVDIPYLISRLDHENPRVRGKAAELLGEMGPRAQMAIPKLIKTLQDKEGLVARQAKDALDKVGKPDKVDLDLLKTCLQDPNGQVRKYASVAIGELGNDARSAVPELLAVLEDSLPDVRRNAAQSLGKVGLEAKGKIVPALTKTLQDEDKEVRVAAAEAMVNVMTPLAAADLQVVLDQLVKHEKDVECRTQGARALGQLTAEAAKIVPVLTALSKTDKEKPLRLAALGSLVPFGPAAKPALPVLIDAVKDSDPEVRQVALLAIAKIGPEAKPAIPALIAALKDDDAGTRENAVLALAKIGPDAKDAAPALGKLLLQDSTSRRLRVQIVTMLGDFGVAAKAAVPDMIQAFADEKLEKELQDLQKVGALAELMKAGMQKEGMVFTLDMARSMVLKKVDKEFQDKNAEALHKIGKVAILPLTRRLADPNTFVRWGSMKTLALFGTQARTAATALYAYGQREQVSEIKKDAETAWKKVTGQL